MVSRSALNSAQTSALTSSMISSMLLVAWILLVTAWSCFWNARRAPTSVCVGAWWLRTALIAFLPARTCGTAYSGLYILAAATLIFNEILTFERDVFHYFSANAVMPSQSAGGGLRRLSATMSENAR